MKRRIWAMLCVVCLCLALFVPTQASGDVCFTSVNDTVLPLTADSMPVWSGGILYVPYSVFDAGTTGISLGTNSIYSKTSGTVSVFNIHQMMVFDLEEGTCVDLHSGNKIQARAILRNGKAYLPAARVCSFFGLSAPSYELTDYGYLVRIKSSDAALTDAQFIDAASNIMSNRLRDYNQSLQAQTQPSTPTPPVSPQEPEPMAVPTYLAFRCDTLQAGAAIADTLDQNGMVGLFFFPAGEIGRQGDLIRRLLGCGHSVGILAEGGSSEQTLTLLDEGSRALDAVAHTRTYFALVPEGHRQHATNDGWVCWNDSITAVPDGSSSAYSHARTTVRTLPKKGSAYITMDDSQFSADALTALLRQLRERKYTVTIPRETRL